MTRIAVNLRLATLLVLAAVLLIPLTFAQTRDAPADQTLRTAPAEGVQRAGKQVPGKVSRTGALETSPMPVQWQLDQLRAQVHALQQQVQSLQSQNGPAAGLEHRIGILESAVQVTPSSVRIQSPGRIELKAQGKLDLQSNQSVDFSASKVNVSSAMMHASGVVQSSSVVTDSVVAKSYTPGAGNIW